VQTPSISLDSQGAQLEYEGEATWPIVRLKWKDYPEAFAKFLKMLTEERDPEGTIFSRVEITRLRITNAGTES